MVTSKGFKKLGRCRVGSLIIAFFNFVKIVYVVYVHVKTSSLRICEHGSYHGIQVQKYAIVPRDHQKFA
ncbi:hypothetical protein Scep_014862 [Stephania cephalantha]|uniref:Uncharacterized protein n=1 Tax=Stephania cephalantha TaxID=152367 RepID=A0AAP0J4M9_9MAGN